MVMPKILRILNKGLIAGVIASALSFVVPIIPCTKSGSLSLCKLPNPFKDPSTISNPNFYNLSTQPLAGLIIQFTAFFIIVSIIFFLLNKKSTAKILDLTPNSKDK